MLYLRKNVLAVVVLGFASGLPLALVASTLSAWLTTAGLSLKTIGLFALVQIPFNLKFMWSPLVDRTKLPGLSVLGRRRSWLLVIEIALFATILAITTFSPEQDVKSIALLTVLFAFLSATHDIVIDAYRIEILMPEEQGAGAAAVTFGYRMGMIASGGGALFVASRYGWQAAYIYVGVLIFSGFIVSCFVGEKPYPVRATLKAKDWVKEAVIDPFADFITREKWFVILLFVLLYKLPEAFAIALTTPFVLKLGFGLEDVATVIKTFGVAATIAGALFSGWLIIRVGLMRALLIGGVLQIVSNFMYIVQARAGAQLDVLYATTAIEYFSSGIATGALVAYLGSLTKINFTATQFALLSSVAALGRTVLSSRTGYIAESYGWEIFYVISALLGVPGTALLYFLKEPTALTESRQEVATGKQAKIKLVLWQKVFLAVILLGLLAYSIYFVKTVLGKI